MKKIKKKWRVLLFVLTAALLVLAACGGDDDSQGNAGGNNHENGNENDNNNASASNGENDDVLKIGFMTSFTGEYAPLAESGRNGFDLYLDENDNKLGGKNVEVIYEDDENDQTQALDGYRKLVTGDDVDLLVGTISSSITYSLRDRIDQDEIVLIKPIPSGNEKTWEGRSDYIFPNLVSNYQNGMAGTEYFAENVGKTAVAIGSDYVAGHEVIDSFTTNFEAAGGEVIEEIYTDLGTTDFTTDLTNIAQLDPDFVFAFVVGVDGIRLVEQYNEFGLNEDIPFTGALEFGDTLLTEPAGEAAEGIISAGIYTPWLENDVNEKFVENYQEKYDGMLPNIFSVGGYDAAQMIDQAVAESGSVDSQDIAEALSGISFDSPRGPTTIDAETKVPVADFLITENVLEDGQIIPEVIDTVEGVEMPTENPSN